MSLTDDANENEIHVPVEEPESTTVTRAKVRNRPLLLSLVGILVIALLGGSFFYLKGGSQRSYFQSLESKDLLKEFANREVALLQGRAFCSKLELGAKPIGYKREKVAVDVFCPAFQPGFSVIPTPEEQESSLLSQLRKASLGGQFSSDAEAVSKSKAVCARLERGGKSQGVLAESIAVSVYCDKYSAGFRVLKEIKVKGRISIYNDSYYFPTIGRYGGSCYGRNAYSDIDEGTSVVIKNQDGRIIAETELGVGSGSTYRCDFWFEVSVLEGESKYAVNVAKRGGVSYSESELKIPGKVRLYLGAN